MGFLGLVLVYLVLIKVGDYCEDVGFFIVFGYL